MSEDSDDKRPVLVKSWNGEAEWQGRFMGWQHNDDGDGRRRLMAVVENMAGTGIVVDGLRVKFLEPSQ